MPRRVVASRVRFVRYPPPPPIPAGTPAPDPTPVAALALDDGAVLADADGAVIVFSAA